MLSIGLMSGTSMDGIDAALLSTDGEAEVTELGHSSLRYHQCFKLLLHAAQHCLKHFKGNLDLARKQFAPWGIHFYLERELKLSQHAIVQTYTELCDYMHEQTQSQGPLSLDQIIHHSTLLHAIAIRQLLRATQHHAEQIDVIGYHGQAMYHRPEEGISLVLGDGQWLSEQFACPVISDFRREDVAAGGQGAPFAPLYHQALARRDKKIPLVVLNCGGIANLTLIRDDDPNSLIAYDTGPGNGLIDRLVRQRTQMQETFDRNGRFGKQGQVHDSMLERLYQESIHKPGDNFFSRRPPKSLDYGDLQLPSALSELSLEDACRTLEAFTADSIVNSLVLLNDRPIPTTWVLAGGGWNNPVIFEELQNRLTKRLGNALSLFKAQQVGWNSQALEAQIFAYLAVRSLEGKPLSVPGTTNVNKPLSGGTIYHHHAKAIEC